jgi:DNA repair protein RecO (recombination protein O)
MSKTYKATGINLKSQPFGESDRLVTILTKEYGLLTAIAPGARKHNSSLGGRSGMFVVNEILIVKGRSLDKITQANTLKSYPGLAKDLGKLAASQYLAEIVLCQALSDNPQDELYELFNLYLTRLEAVATNNASAVLALLSHAVFQFLALFGLAPQVEACCLTQKELVPDFQETRLQVGFSISAGGVVCLATWERLRREAQSPLQETTEVIAHSTVSEAGGSYNLSSSPSNNSPVYETIYHQQELPTLLKRLNATELSLLQQLSSAVGVQDFDAVPDNYWLSIEQVLRQYAQYHFGRSIRSAVLIDSYFATNHDATV